MSLRKEGPRSAPTRWPAWAWGVLALAATPALAPFDVPVARACYQSPPPEWVVGACRLASRVAGDGLGVLVAVLAAAAIASLLRRPGVTRLPRMLAAAFGGGLLVDGIKLCVCRMRPHSVDLDTATFFDTFHGWFPFLTAGAAGQSFPSGHSATALGLAVTLAALYRPAAIGFGAVAALACLSRVLAHVHYPTDAVVGAAIGGLWAGFCHTPAAAPVLTRGERWIARRIGRPSDAPPQPRGDAPIAPPASRAA